MGRLYLSGYLFPCLPVYLFPTDPHRKLYEVVERVAMESAQTGLLNLSTVALWTKAPLQLCEELWVATEPTILFTYLADHERIGEWFPLVRQVELCVQSNAGQEQLIRCCTLIHGAKLIEEILSSDQPLLYGYRIHEQNLFGLRQHLAIIQVQPEGAGARLLWHHFFEHADPETMRQKLASNLHAAFVNLQRRFDGSV